MHIEFKKLTLHNFISFGHAELTFTDEGFIRVTGINENPDDLAASNGSGKSSLWEGIVWALTGDTIRGTKQVSNLYGDDGTYVELEFSVDSTLYNVLRSKDHKEYKTNLRILIDGKDSSGKGIRDSEKLLTQYLPDINASLLGSVIILGQGLPQKFTNNTPSGRKEVLEKLSKSDFMIEDLKSRVAKRKTELNDTIRELQDKIIYLTGNRDFLLKQIESSEQSLAQIDPTTLFAQLASVEEELKICQQKQPSIENSISKHEDEVKELNQRLLQLTTEQTEKQNAVKEEYATQIAEYQTELATLNSEINSCKKEIAQLESITDICPTCGQKLPNVYKPDTTELKTTLNTIEEKKNVGSRRLEELKAAQLTKVNSIVQFYISEKSTLTSVLDQHNTMLKALKATQIELYNEERELQTKLNSLRSEIAHIDATIANYKKIILDNKAQISNIDADLLYNNNEKDLQQSRIDIINKFDTALKRDFRGYLLATIIDYIQLRAKEYAKVIFETDKVGFSLDGNNIDINYMGKAYENLSGGEKQKIDLIIQFSIRDMLCNHLGFTSNILVLDEVFDGLDMTGCQKVLDVISAISDIKNIFIVTHRKDLSIPTDKEIIVVKSESGISEIR